jgi:hypothetical protein
MTLNAQDQASRWRIAKNSRSRRFIAQLTPWRGPDLVVNAGDYVQSYSMAWKAQNSGTTGAGPAPNNSTGNTVSDGNITWSHEAILLTAKPNI